MEEPTFDELYAAVLDKVQHTAIGDRPSAEQHEHAQDIMDALAEAFHIGLNKGMKYVHTLVTTTEPPQFPPANPYERDPRV